MGAMVGCYRCKHQKLVYAICGLCWNMSFDALVFVVVVVVVVVVAATLNAYLGTCKCLPEIEFPLPWNFCTGSFGSTGIDIYLFIYIYRCIYIYLLNNIYIFIYF